MFFSKFLEGTIYSSVKNLFCTFFQFNPVSSLSDGDPGYNPTPRDDDKVHVLVCLVSANTAEIKQSVLQKMAEIREVASNLGKSMMFDIGVIYREGSVIS